MTRQIFGAVGALALAATPITAHAADASALSLNAATMQDEEGGLGSGGGIIAGVLGVGIAAILVLGLTIGSDGGEDDDLPTSP